MRYFTKVSQQNVNSYQTCIKWHLSFSKTCLKCLLAKQHTVFKWKDVNSVFPVSQGSAETLIRRGGKLSYLSIACSLWNTPVKKLFKNKDAYSSDETNYCSPVDTAWTGVASPSCSRIRTSNVTITDFSRCISTICCSFTLEIDFTLSVSTVSISMTIWLWKSLN